MKHFNTYINVPESEKNCVVVIGNFDGVHLGHKALLNKAKEIAKKEHKLLGVLTFEPHPRQLFRPDEPPYRITPKELKLERLEKLGVDVVYTLPFDWDFASQSAQHFIDNILIENLDVAHVIVGEDFRFGQLRKGTHETISESGIPVTTIEKIKSRENTDISSSNIRQHLRYGKINEANAMLGWNWEIRGTVFKGDRRGHALGYPTANVKMDDVIHPAYGIYACFVKLGGQKDWMMGATNIGIRPMFEVPTGQIETYIFDFDQEIYGETLCVQPVQLLRSEAKFDSLDDLIAQMEKDCIQAREILEAQK